MSAAILQGNSRYTALRNSLNTANRPHVQHTPVLVRVQYICDTVRHKKAILSLFTSSTEDMHRWVNYMEAYMHNALYCCRVHPYNISMYAICILNLWLCLWYQGKVIYCTILHSVHYCTVQTTQNSRTVQMYTLVRVCNRVCRWCFISCNRVFVYTLCNVSCMYFHVISCKFKKL